ncbi:MAG: rhomboid family intramembrane serine protease [Chitinophagaceae bacterium]|nr:MAG: rhomboid family intramembrane serine protease [Chitinophagaceae bacterium]
MSYYDREPRRHLSFAQLNNSLVTLIAINLVIFVTLAFVQAVYFLQYGDSGNAIPRFNADWVSWFALPADPDTLLTHPWTILTYMFTHTGVWHVIGNMLWLWVFGYILQDLTGTKKLVPLYLYGALGGALVFILAYNIFPGLRPQLPYQTLIGASAGVMAIAVAVTTISPGYRVLPVLNGGIPIWIIMIIYLIIDLAGIPSGNTGGHLAHLAGALMGFLFVVSFRRGYDWGAWINNFFEWINNLFNPEKPKRGRVIKSELFYKSKSQPYKKTANVTEQRIDEILDKISVKGYDSLTDDEKDLLKRASGKNEQ